MVWKMRKIHSLDFVLLESSLFGVNQGYPGRYIGPGIAWMFGILNLCLSVTVTYCVISGFFIVKIDLSAGNLGLILYYSTAAVMVIIIQMRFSYRRHKMAGMVKELARLDELSTWRGDASGCIVRMLVHLVTCLIHQIVPTYRREWAGFRIVTLCFYWCNYTPSAAVEFLGQTMLLFQHEFKVLSQMTKDIGARKYFEMEKLRALNRRHASLIALADKLSRITSIDSLLIIETERLLLLINIFVKVNWATATPLNWHDELVGVIFYSYRIERITHCCFRGHRIRTEADRFVSTLDEIDPLDLETDEFFTELQIFRKQARLRKLRFDCNRFIKLDMKLIFQILKNLLTLLIVLVQLTSDFKAASSKPSNATTKCNLTENFGFQTVLSNSSTLV